MKIKQKERETDREVGHKVILRRPKKEMKSENQCVSEYLECYSNTTDQEHYGILRSKPLSSEEVHTQEDVQKTFCWITNLRTR